MKVCGLARVHLHVLPAGPIKTNAYLLTAPERGEAVLIDAPGEVWRQVGPLLAEQRCRLTELWLTHGHWDHLQGGAEIVRQTGAKVRAHAADRVLIETPAIMERFMGEKLDLEPVPVDHWLVPGEDWSALGTTVAVRYVPGHCPGSVLFYFAAEKAAFVSRPTADATSIVSGPIRPATGAMAAGDAPRAGQRSGMNPAVITASYVGRPACVTTSAARRNAAAGCSSCVLPYPSLATRPGTRLPRLK